MVMGAGRRMVCTYYRAFHTCSLPIPALFHPQLLTAESDYSGHAEGVVAAPMTKLNAVGMPTTAMWLQCLLVSLFILLVSFGGDTASSVL